MAETISKVGIISCSGEQIAEGTVARQAVRRVLEALRPQQTVTLCLPLFLAGEVGERRFAREHPTITVDGCDKRCAKRGTEQFSGEVDVSLVVTDILGGPARGCHRSTRDADKADEAAIWLVADRVATEVDALIAMAPAKEPAQAASAASCGCACGKPNPEGALQVDGKTVAVNGLPLIFDHLFKQNVQPGNDSSQRLIETVRIYHEIPPSEESLYRDALAAAYQDYYQRRA